ncbi:MAG TPA: hypothetical protein VFO85_19260 [Vicinamibacteria bacterium]|nr:hypothetical protein [Vicinamibacteria bacterium]
MRASAWGTALMAAVVAAGGCRAPDPQAEVALSDVETYWAVDRPTGGTQYIAPVVRFRLHNKGARPLRSIQASATFRIKGETQTWSGAFQQVAPLAGKPLEPGQGTLVVLKPEGEGRYSSTVPPEDMLAHQGFRDVWVEMFVRVGSSGWTKMGQEDVARRIGARAAVAEEAR